MCNDGILDDNECGNFMLDISSTLGAPITVIPLDGGNGFTVVDADGSGVDIRFVESLGGRPGYPRTGTQGGQTVILASDVASAPFTSIIDPALGNVTRAILQYDILFYATGTTTPVAVNNLSFSIGDLDSNEILGAFSKEPDLINPLPTNITYTFGTSGNYYKSDSSSIHNGTTAADLIFEYNSPTTDFSFIQEKHSNNNLGLMLKLISFSFCQDTDGDGITDEKDLDSDGDGCSDADEAYTNTDADGGDDGVYVLALQQ